MGPKKKLSNKGLGKSLKQAEKSPTATAPFVKTRTSGSPDLPMGIDISIDSITYFDTTALDMKNPEYPKQIKFWVTFENDFLAVSEPITISNEWYHKLDFSCYFPVESVDAQLMDKLCKQPFMITLTEVKANTKPDNRLQKTAPRTRTVGSRGTTADATTPRGEHSPELTLQANLDILPLLLGETNIKETLLLRPANPNPWVVDSTLPRIEVTAVPINLLFVNQIPPFSNLLCITMESLYNPIKDVMNCDAFCFAGLSILVQPDATSTGDAKVIELNFEHPQMETSKCQDPVKRWFTLSHIQGGSTTLTSYRNRDDLLDVKNPDGVDYKASMETSQSRVKWNQFRRTWVPVDMEKEIFRSLQLYKTWLMELRFKVDQTDLNKLKSRSDYTIKDEGMYSFVAYLDVSNLLYPGVNSTRVVAQLMTHNPENVKLRTGLDKPLVASTERIALSRPSAKSSRRSKFTRNSKRPLSAGVIPKLSGRHLEEKKESEMHGRSRSASDAPALPVFDDTGKPVFIVLQVELYKSFRPRKSSDELVKSVCEVVVPRTRVPREVFLKKTAQECFQSCIKKITVLIGKEYEDFVGVWNVGLEHCHTDYISVSEEPDFYDYLMVSSGYQTIKDTLRNCLVNYVRDCIGPPQETTSQSLKRYAGLLFSRLVDETHVVLNGMLNETEEVPAIDASSHITEIELLFCAVEASEQGDYNGAKENLMKRLHYYGDKNAEYWVDLAVICMRHGDIARAESSLRTALSIYPRCKDGLLMYAVLMAMEGRHEMAEMFFDALTQFYPRFFQGWFAFHMFYILIERKEGADITIVLASKCLMDLNIESTPKDYRRLMLSWCPELGPADNGYFQTAVYLISLCLFEFAEMCLAQELEQKKEETLHYLYYLAVSHHVQGKYKESNSHLDTAINYLWSDDRIWSLMGHNFYKLGDMANAKRCYQVAYDTPDRPDDIHLTFIRLAEINMEEGNFEVAKNLYINALKQNSSTSAWYGLGKVFYLMDDLENAEIAMNECNLIDNRNPNVWAYLGLINILKHKGDLGDQCIFEAQKHGLSDEGLISEINEIMFKNIELERMYRKGPDLKEM